LVQVAIAGGPALLAVLLSLVAWLLPREAAWSCAPFLSIEMMTTINQLSPKAQATMSPCSVLAVQMAILLPLVILLILIFRMPPNLGQARRVSFLVYFAVAVLAFMLWMETFFVGAGYAISATGRRPWGSWLSAMALVSSLSTFSALFVLVIACRKARAWYAWFAKGER
jgi:hypothetical protein